ncbi:MAG: AsmA family protein [Methylococcales bacterium]|nr:AsmA family protein [Methylococcales bacterium]
MRNSLKIILSVVAAVVLLIVIAGYTLTLFIDPNDYKSEIAAAVKDKTGRDLSLEGDLKLSFLPMPSIATGKMALGNAKGFQDLPFATLEDSTIAIKLLPLITKKIEVSHLLLKGLTLNLAKNPQGIRNWDDLMTLNNTLSIPPPNDDIGKQDEAETLVTFTIDSIAVENAQVNWDNQKSGKHLVLKDINLNTDKFTFDEPFKADLSLALVNAEKKLTESIKLSTTATVNEKLDNFVFSQSHLQTTTESEKIPGKSLTTELTISNMALDRVKQTAEASGLKLQTGDLTVLADITGSHINDKFSFQGPVIIPSFSPVKLMKQLSIAPPVTQDANALIKLETNFNLLATEDSVELQNLVMTLDDTKINGSAGFKNFSTPAMVFNLAMDTIDLDRYLAHAADKSSRPITSPAVALAVAASALPIETLRKWHADGQLSLGKFKISDLIMQDVQLNLNAKEGIVTTQQSSRQFYQGSYTSHLSMDVRNKKPALAVNEKLTHVQIEPLLKDYKGAARISGIADISTQLQGQGDNARELKSSLNGQLDFLLKDSVVKGFNLQKMIDRSKALINGNALPVDYKNDQSLFSEISGTATINNNVIENNNLIAKSSKIRTSGKGNVNLATEQLDYKLSARLLKVEATATEPEQFHDTPINILVGGTLSKPSYTLDASALLTDKNKAKIEKLVDKNKDKINKIADKLDKKLGPGVGDLLKGFLKKH